jgi:hypothetical protein
LHVIVSIERGFEIHFFDIGTTKFGSWGTDDTVPHYFCRDYVGCMCGEFVQIINGVAPNSDPNLIWFVVLRVLVDDNSCRRDSLIFPDAPDFSMGEIENHVGTNSDTFFSLGKAMLGWEFRFLVPISGTPIVSKILILFLIPKIPVGIFFEIPMSGESENWNSNLRYLKFL